MMTLEERRIKCPETEAAWVNGVIDSIETLRFMHDALPEVATTARKQIRACVKSLSRIAHIFTPEWATEYTAQESLSGK